MCEGAPHELAQREVFRSTKLFRIDARTCQDEVVVNRCRSKHWILQEIGLFIQERLHEETDE